MLTNEYLKRVYEGLEKRNANDPEDITAFFSDIDIKESNNATYLTALYKGKQRVHERILPLDAERFKKGDLLLENLLGKYCSYIRTSFFEKT